MTMMTKKQSSPTSPASNADTNSVVSTDVSEYMSDSSMDLTPIKDGNPLMEMLHWLQTPTSPMKKAGRVSSALKEECKEESKEEWIELNCEQQVPPIVLFEETKEEEVEVEEEEVEAKSDVEEEQVKTDKGDVDRVVLAFEVVLLMAIVLYVAYPYLKETPAGRYLSMKGAEAVDMIASAPIFEWFHRTYAQLLSSVHGKAMGVSETTFEKLEQMYPGSRNYISGLLMHVHLDWIVVKPPPPPVKVTHKIWRFLRALLLPKVKPQAPVANKPGKFAKWVKSALANPVSEDLEPKMFRWII
jgi:hypothetical protein